MKRSILFVAQYFPPRPAAAARRLRQLAETAREEYEQVYVIRGDRGYVGEELEGVAVVVVPLRDLRSVAGGAGPAGTVKKTGRSNRLTAPLRKLRQAFPFVYLTDDGGMGYRKQAYAAAVKIVEQGGVDTVISSFRPWSDHLVARRLKKRFPQLRWIADFRDLPVDPLRRDVWWPDLQRRWAGWVVAPADEVWAVSRGQAEQLAGLHPRIRVRRSALDRLPPARTAPVTERFTIVYTGSLYPGLQTVEPLVKALADHLAAGRMDPEKLLLSYAGKDADLWGEWTAGLPDHSVRSLGNIAPASAQKMQENAQLLLLLNWSAPNYYGVLTAKLWDYLASGRPVLALVNGPADPELTEIIEGAGPESSPGLICRRRAGAVFADGQPAELSEWLLERYGEWRTHRTLEWSSDTEFLSAYLRTSKL